MHLKSHFKKLSLIQLDVWASIMWFCMDFCWMWNNINLACFFIPPTCLLILGIIIKTKSKQTFEITMVTILWFCMNSSWLLSELFNQHIYLKVLASSFGIVAFFKLIKLINKPEIINNFKRLL